MAHPAELIARLPAHLQKSGLIRLASTNTGSSAATRSSAATGSSAAGSSSAGSAGLSSAAMTADAAATADTSTVEEPSVLGPSRAGDPSVSVSLDDWFGPAGIAGRGVIELACEGGGAGATTLALQACRRLQDESKRTSGESVFCAFVDPTGTLYGPGARALGVSLDKLLVVRPSVEALARVALRLAESKLFPLVVVDLIGPPGAALEPRWGQWVRVVRRLSLALEKSSRSVLLLTDKHAPRSLPLPVTRRIEVYRGSPHELELHVTKNVRGVQKARLRWGTNSEGTAARNVS